MTAIVCRVLLTATIGLLSFSVQGCDAKRGSPEAPRGHSPDAISSTPAEKYSISSVELVNRTNWKSVEIDRNIAVSLKHIIEKIAIYSAKKAKATQQDPGTSYDPDPGFSAYKVNCFFSSKEEGENALAAYMDFDSSGKSMNDGISPEESEELSRWMSQILHRNSDALK